MHGGRALVVGGGIGGLTAAATLRAVGWDVTVLEQARALAQVGAGIQVASNASRVFAGLGLADALAERAVEPTGIDVRSARTGRLLHHTPLGTFARATYGAPYFHLHRADLLDVLVAAVPADVIRLRSVVTAVDDRGDGVTVTLDDGTTLDADVVVAADGIHSPIRALLHGPATSQFSGMVCWRGLIPAERVTHLDLARICHVWYGPDASVVAYWVRGGELFNVVGIVPGGPEAQESWSARGDRDRLRADFAAFEPTVRGFMAEIDDPFLWAIHDRDPLPWWTRGRVTLLGDAAHPMLPYMAQGACQAIEDAAVLARCLGDVDPSRTDDVVAALGRYEAIRRPRTTEVQQQSRAGATVFHLRDWRSVWRRNQQLRAAMRADPAVTARTWLYGYDADRAVDDHVDGTPDGVVAAAAPPTSGAATVADHWSRPVSGR